jgi:predicted secreted protein
MKSVAMRGPFSHAWGHLRIKRASAVASAFVLLAFAGCAAMQPQAPTLVGAAQSGGAVHLHKGDTLVVALASSPTAGIRWQAQPMQGAVLQQIGMSDLLPQQLAEGTVGSPNDTVYRFRANEIGTTTLELALKPTGDPSATGERTVRYDVSVGPRPGEYAQAWAKSR